MRSLSIVLFIALSFCQRFTASAKKSIMALPHVMVYKTKGDYRQYVAVELSADKKTVVSYPDPKDIITGSAPSGTLPVLLHKGYLLDKRGISVNTAFIKITYAEYSKLQSAPSPEQLYNMIIDKDPITEIYDCGVRNPQKNSVKQLNQLIDKKQLKKKFRSFKH